MNDQLINTFTTRVLDVVRGIQSGQTMTYGDVAEAAGRPGAARAVGNIMGRNWDKMIPCHRVVRADGSIGGYNRGIGRKFKKLKQEGNKTYG